MAAASCVQEEKEEKEIQEPSDAIAQGNNVIKWFTLSHIVCRDAAAMYFAIHRSTTEGDVTIVHYSLVSIQDVSLEALIHVLLSWVLNIMSCWLLYRENWNQ